MSTNENRSTVGRRRLLLGGLLAIASALSMLVATPASAASAPAAPTNLRTVYVDGVLKSIAWDAAPRSSFVLYLNGPSGPVDSGFTQTSKTSRTMRELVFVDCLHAGATLHLSIRAHNVDGYSGFSEVFVFTIPKSNPR